MTAALIASGLFVFFLAGVMFYVTRSAWRHDDKPTRGIRVCMTLATLASSITCFTAAFA